MKAFLTGGTGFIGGHVARKLRERGHDVLALVRSPDKAGELSALGCRLVTGDLSDAAAIRTGVEGCDAVFHLGAIYKVGVPRSEHEALYEANVLGTELVLDAAIDAGIPRIVYVSTVAVFGNTDGQVVDESYQRPSRKWLSEYDRTKTLAHDIAVDRSGRGAPIVIVQPGGVYGPRDHSEIGNLIRQTRAGRMFMKVFPDSGIIMAHVEDIAEGIVLAYEKGTIGESYVLGGDPVTYGELIDRVARLAGRRPPVATLPAALIKLSAPLGPVIGPLLGFPPNLGELVKVSDGVTFYATDEKARRELGYETRSLEEGLRETVAAR